MPRVQSKRNTKPSQTTPYDSSSKKAKAAPAQKISWTDEQDKIIVAHVLAKSHIEIRFDWPALIKESFPGLSPKQVSQVSFHDIRSSIQVLTTGCSTSLQMQNHWEKKVKPALFPNLANTTKSKAGGTGGETTSAKKAPAPKTKEIVMKYEAADSDEGKDDFEEEEED